MLNLAVLLEDSARKVPERDAVVFGDTRLSYAKVDSMANQVANLLVQRGIRPGEKVALSCPNLPHFPVIYYGILKAGAVVVPLNVLLKGREVAYHLGDSDAKAYFCFEGTAELAMAEAGLAGFNDADGCEHFFVIPADPTGAVPVEAGEHFFAVTKDQPTTFETLVTEARAEGRFHRYADLGCRGEARRRGLEDRRGHRRDRRDRHPRAQHHEGLLQAA